MGFLTAGLLRAFKKKCLFIFEQERERGRKRKQGRGRERRGTEDPKWALH